MVWKMGGELRWGVKNVGRKWGAAAAACGLMSKMGPNHTNTQ